MSNNEASTSESNRKQRKRTRKEHRVYEIYQKKSECYALNKQLREFMKNLATTDENVQSVYDKLQEVKELFALYKRRFMEWYSSIEDEGEKILAQDWFDEKNEDVTRFIKKTEEYIVKNSADNNIEEQLNLSGSTCTASWIKDREEEAEIRALLTTLPKKQQLQNEIEKINLQEKLAIIQAKEQIYQDAGQPAQFPPIPECSPWQPRVPTPSIPAKPEPTDIFDVDDDYKVKVESPFKEPLLEFLDKQNKLTEILAKQQQQSLLPKLQLSPFTNNPLDYEQFIRNFEHHIETKTDSNQVRFQHLQQCLQGEAKELIKGCLYKDADIGYHEAKQLLQQSYGDPYKVSTAYIKRVNEWPTLKPGDDSALQRLSVFLTQCVSAMESLSFLSILDHPHNLQTLVRKLPYNLQERWRRHVLKLRQSKVCLPGFQHLCKFIVSEAEVAADPIFSKEALKGSTAQQQQQPKSTTTYRVATRATTMSDTSSSTREDDCEKCPLCQAKHDLDNCEQFQRKSIAERRDFVKEKGLCFACYKTGHRSRGCTSKRICDVCKKCHPTSLHDEHFKQRAPLQTNEHRENIINARTMNTDLQKLTVRKSSIEFLPIVPVKLTAGSQVIETYAMLDNCSTGTFITEEATKQLKITGVQTNVVVKTMNGTKLFPSKRVTGLAVSNLEETNVVQLPQTFSRDKIPATQGEIPRPDLVRQWPHLKTIADKMPTPLQRQKVDLLIGMNCPAALQPIDFVTGKQGDPYGILTFAGWTVVGPMLKTTCYSESDSFNRIMATSVCESRVANLSFAVQSQVKEVVNPDTLCKLIDIEFSDPSYADEQKISIDDTQFMRKMDDGIQLVNGHYQLPLPFKDHDVTMPSNKEQVKRKMQWLKKKLLHNNKLFDDYKDFMKDIIDKDYARKVPAHLLLARPGRTWYIPHHGVYHPQKPEKIRVVFNCSAKYHGVSLNDKLLQGPDLTNSLIGVLVRFRKKPVAFMGDIDSMFHQVRVHEEDRNFLRFLWWTDADLSTEPEEYQMNVHLFGAVSSPSCANYAVKRIAEDFKSEMSKETVETLRRNFYVDDCLRSEESEEDAIQRVHDVMNACRKGGFSLSKIISNKRSVIEAVPQEKRCKALKNVELTEDLPIERALGVQWSVEADELGFRIVLKDSPLTRRSILATISSVYDPLGIAAPVVLQGKKILQELCQSNVDWDDAIPDKYRKIDDKVYTSKKPLIRNVTSDDLNKAETVILKVLQSDAFVKESAVLGRIQKDQVNRAIQKRNKSVIKKSSTLFRLDPFIDDDGLIRVGGRLRKSQELTDNLKHPVVIPKKSHITTLLIRDAHEKTAHSGRGMTLNELRNHFWVVNANSAVRWLISKCVLCKRLRSNPAIQKMADLPEDRVTTAPPFTHCAVDYFGPCTVKEGRKELKRYGVLFTCLSSRAVHLESAISLETDSFLNALRRFIARRGPIKSMRSDQGTNLVGAVNELKDNLKKMNQAKIKEYLLRHENADWLSQWSFNPPSASHMGGSWERLIRTVRTILVALTREHGQAINDESFRTLLAEVESIVNSRPLTFPTDDPQDLTGPLTPNHLLTMKSKIVLPPPGDFQREDIYCRKQWRRVQYLAELFWSRWKQEYLQTLQVRGKWSQPQRNLKPGDIVLVKDERTPRNTWPLARITEVFPDEKGFVRSVKLKTQISELSRPIHKLITVLET